MNEKDIQHLIYNDEIIKQNLLELLNVQSTAIISREETFINGITVDFMVTENEIIKSLVEVKQHNINITDIVRGIGQVFQYEHFYNTNQKPKNNVQYTFDKSNNFSTVLLIPSEFILHTDYYLGDLRYPETTKLVEFNVQNHNLRVISENELDQYKASTGLDTISICQYYIRDNRLHEIYILLKYLLKLKANEVEKINRAEVEKALKQLGVINNGNWRNCFISLSLLGFIDSNNIPTLTGVHIGNKEFESFATEMYGAYLKPFIDLILTLGENKQIMGTNKQLCNTLKERYDGKDILFLTQSDGRYMSSFLNIMRDDFGILDFKPNTKERNIVYNISELNNETIKTKIRNNNLPKSYIDKYIDFVKEGKL